MTVKPIKFGTGRQLTDLAYQQTLADFFSHYNQVPVINQKITMVQNVISDINQGYLPSRITDPTITEEDVLAIQQHVIEKYPDNPEAGNQYWESLIEPLEELDATLADLRDVLISNFDMYSFVSNDFVYALDAYLESDRVLEIMSGHGYLSAGLHAVNPEREIVASDDLSWHNQPGEHTHPVTEVIKLDAIESLEKYSHQVDTVIMSWAPDTDDIDWRVLNWLRENGAKVKLLVIGERNGATNSKKFWHDAKLTPLNEVNKALKSFDLYDEKIYLAR